MQIIKEKKERRKERRKERSNPYFANRRVPFSKIMVT